MPDDKFRQLVLESSSRSEIFRKMKLRTSGAAYSAFNNHLAKLGLSTNHFKIGFQKGKRPKIPNDKMFVENSPIVSSTIRKRLIDDNLIPYCCAKCSNSGVWFRQPISLQLDHINGIRNDHRLINLQFLCPNCHTQTLTYGGKKHKRIHICPNCQSEFPGYGKLCIKCSAKTRQTLALPSKDELEKLIWQSPCMKVAKRFGCSSNGLKRHLLKLGIKLPPVGYWQRRRAGKTHEESLLRPPNRSKLRLFTLEETQEIKRMATNGTSFRKIGKIFKKSHQTISRLINRQNATYNKFLDSIIVL